MLMTQNDPWPSRIVSLFFHPNVWVEHQQTAESLFWKWVWLVGVNVNVVQLLARMSGHEFL